MDATDIILKNKGYKEQIERMDYKTIILIAKDPVAALDAARKGIKQNEPEKLDDVAYQESIAIAIQKLAQEVSEKSRIK